MTYRIRSEDTWLAVRDAYLSGEAAESVCRRFGVGLSAFRKRAAAQGWRRSDQDEPPPRPWIELDQLEDEDWDELARTAWLKMQQAIANDRAVEALRWLALNERLSALALDAEPEVDLSSTEPEAGPSSAKSPPRDDVHGVHPDFFLRPPSPAHADVLARAERRRRLRDARKRRSSA